MTGKNSSKLKLISSMAIFGTIGIFVRYISLPSSVIAFTRGITGTVFLILVMLIIKKPPDFVSIKRNLKLLILSGACIGVNWILLFEAYRYTTVATATLCYYLSPIIVIAVSPLFFKEKLTVKKLICTVAALIGMVLVSGIVKNGTPKISELKGVLLGLGAAVLYASCIIINKNMKDVSSYDRTVTQLFSAAVILLPYCLITEDFSSFSLTGFQLLMLVFVGIVHTGVAYWLYFSSIEEVNAQSVALLGYIDPVIAVILSALILKEPMGVPDIIGAVLILGAAFISEFNENKKSG